MMKKAVLTSLAFLLVFLSFSVRAQSVLTPITGGLVWTPSQWTAAWQGEQDYPASTAIPLFSWTTAGRPSSPLAGWIGYNTTLNQVEYWNGTSWVQESGSSSFGGTVIVNANNTCATDATSTIQAALNTGNTVYLPRGCYLVSSDLTFTTKNQILYGDGPGCYSTLSGVCTGGPFGTVIYAAATAGFTKGVLYFNIPGEEGPQIQNLGISVAQPDTATRGSLNNFVPEIYAQNQPRFRLFNLKMDNCITCVDMRGNSGGAYLNTLQMAGYGTTSTGGGILLIDGSLDTVRIDGLHIYNFDMTANQQTIFHAPATIGISSGRADDLEISNLLEICGTGINFFYGTGGPGGTSWQPGFTFGVINNSGFDTYNGIVAAGSGSGLTGPNISMSSSYFSLGSSTVQAIVASAGNFQLSSITVGQGNAGSNSAVALSDSTGSLNFSWDSGWFQNAGNDVTDISVSGDVNSVVLLNNIRFYKAINTNYTLPAINIASGPRATLTNNSINDKGTGSGTFINIAADAFHVVMGNSAPGWTLTFPTATYGIYTCNTVGASPACGSGSGSGVTSLTGGTNIAVSSSTGAVTISTVTNPTFSTSVSTPQVKDASGNNLINNTGGITNIGLASYGPISAQNSLVPSTNNAYLLGNSGGAWSAIYGILYYAGPSNTAGVSCSGTPTSSFATVYGIVTHC